MNKTISKFKLISIKAMLLIVLGASMLFAGSATFDQPNIYAATASSQCASSSVDSASKACTAAGSTNNNVVKDLGSSTVYDVISKVINFISLLVGLITVFMIVFAGFQFITSGGSSEAVAKARQALLYAVIGIFVVVLSQFLVRFVIDSAVDSSVAPKTVNSSSSTPTSELRGKDR